MKTFEELELIAPLQHALADEKYVTPTPIQAQTVPPALLGRDVLGCAQTGTGKTAAFALPILNKLGKHNRKAAPNFPLALVLAPTRELAIQIAESCATYGKSLQLRHALAYGGVSQLKQVRSLNRGAHILVATPGRLLDLMEQGHVRLDQLEMFVLDEADRMLDMGFLPDLKRIISRLPKQRQSLFFSATMPPKITELSKRLLSNPVSVNVTPKSISLELIEQKVLFVERSGKQALLQKVLAAAEVDRALVFTRTKRGANRLAEKLVRIGIKADAIHGNKSQNARQQALTAFRRNQVHVLVATDVAARGIDVDGITHVVNFDLPDDPENYVHRIGRTGRAGAAGTAISFCSDSERGELWAIESLIGKRVPIGGTPHKVGHKADQLQVEQPEPRRPRKPRARRANGAPRTAVKAAAAQRSKSRCLAGASGEQDKPRRKRKPKRSGRSPR